MDTYTQHRQEESGFKPQNGRSRKTLISWRCAAETCSVCAATDIDVSSIIRISSNHNHVQPSLRQLDLNKARTTIRRKAETQVHEKPSNVICTEASKYSTLDGKDSKRQYDIWHYHRSRSIPTYLQMFPVPFSRAFRCFSPLHFGVLWRIANGTDTNNFKK